MDEPAQWDDSVRPDPESPAATGWGLWTRRKPPLERTTADDAEADESAGERPARRRPATAPGNETTHRRRPTRPVRPPSEPPRIRFVWGAGDAEVAEREASAAAVDEVHFADEDADATVLSRRSSVADVDTAQPRRGD